MVGKRIKTKAGIRQTTLDAIDVRKILIEKLLNARTKLEITRLNREYNTKHKEVKCRVREDSMWKSLQKRQKKQLNIET